MAAGPVARSRAQIPLAFGSTVIRLSLIQMLNRLFKFLFFRGLISY